MLPCELFKKATTIPFAYNNYKNNYYYYYYCNYYDYTMLHNPPPTINVAVNVDAVVVAAQLDAIIRFETIHYPFHISFLPAPIVAVVVM